MNVEPIGVIHSPFAQREDMPIQPIGAAGAAGRVEVFEPFRAGLRDLEGFSHVILLYHFHRSEGFALTVRPFLDDREHGIFATRAPRRPNPIGLSVLRLEGVEQGVLRVRDVDILDGTPLLDIKPYVPDFDRPEAVRVGWLEGRRQRVREARSDGRFA